MYVNNLLPTSRVGEDVHWPFEFNCVLRRLLCVQSIRLKGNINFPTPGTNKFYEYEIRSVTIMTNVTMTRGRTCLGRGYPGLGLYACIIIVQTTNHQMDHPDIFNISHTQPARLENSLSAYCSLSL